MEQQIIKLWPLSPSLQYVQLFQIALQTAY